MSGLTAVARPLWREEHLDPDSLEELVLVCLEGLANLADAHGQRRRAARLLDAAGALRRDSEPAHPAGLTQREWDVALLVTRGWSNRQIAEELVISERTVDTHVSHMLRKLGLISRAQIAAWVVSKC
jgi:DNA-binding NarL/FixJ family response regulator